MYLVVCYEPFHGNKVGFVVSSLLEARGCVADYCSDLDFEISEFAMGRAIDLIMTTKHGHIYGGGKTEMEVSVLKIEFGEKIDLE